MTELNIQIEELISNNATDFQISKVFKTYYKNYLDSIDTTVETTGGKDFFIKHTKHTDKFLILLYNSSVTIYISDYCGKVFSLAFRLYKSSPYRKRNIVILVFPSRTVYKYHCKCPRLPIIVCCHYIRRYNLHFIPIGYKNR